ncbi:membrane protein insertase YidC [Pleionea sp. CnH1-48]|uniref:membrane protein insertase YidC n=1 Tax=Pleionea sp. CnH1-48 TaxID=2954494 RepID=UPI00209746CF|nr:membrane protein insertase YidC [Pleionea sp. CnH1-48]MCO7226618.1 membrane protein insertase YidC [Pleionea sp. CnH1-48]
MESSRGILVLALAFISFLLFQKWQEDYGPKPQPTTSEQIVEQPKSNESVAANVTEQPADNSKAVVANNATVAEVITLSNEVLTVQVNTLGGTVVSSILTQFSNTQENPDDHVQLLTSRAHRTYVAASELSGAGAPENAKQQVIYRVASKPTADKPELILEWTNEQGIVFEKIFKMHENQYDIDVFYRVKNTTATNHEYTLTTQLIRDRIELDTDTSGFGMQTYLGAAYSTQESQFEKYDFDDMDDAPLAVITQGGWISFIQHYFISAWIPNKESVNKITTQYDKAKRVYIVGVEQDKLAVAAGQTQEFHAKLYLGPKDQDVLASLAPGLDLTVDYGIFWWLGQPIFWLLTMFQGFVSNWGVAIILVTITVKIFLYPLANAQYRSFAKMRLLQPKLEQLKERYGEDRQRMSQAMMEMYKKEKVNPLGGCLPLLIQMPVFLALYWVLMESVEIRQADFALWITDLSAKDPYFVLPILMGISMWLMQKMQPTSPTMDPMQLKIMQMLPVMMTVFFIFFPAGLVLYWLVNNLLSIAQQVYITKKIEKEHAAGKNNSKKK